MICAEGLVIITKYGRAVAALIAITDDEESERLIAEDSSRLQRTLNEAGELVRREGGIPRFTCRRGKLCTSRNSQYRLVVLEHG